jgi:hypothetical protein
VGVERGRLSNGAWQLEPRAVFDLPAKISERGVPLAEFAKAKPYYGIKTGLNEAFLIDTAKRNSLVAKDPRCSEILRPYLRGQDIKRWSPEWAGLWMIFMRRGVPIDEYPSIRDHLTAFRERLEPKPKDWMKGDWKGRKPGAYQWYEVQDPVEYWELFSKPKILYQDITWKSNFCLDLNGTLPNNTIYFLPTPDPWVLSVLNSPIGWWYAWRKAQHGKDEALRYFNTFVEGIPIPCPSDGKRSESESIVHRLTEIAKSQHETVNSFLDWLKVEHQVDEPSTLIQSCIGLDNDAFVAEVRKARGKKNPLSLAALRSLREEHTRTIVPAQALAREALVLERKISDLVNEAYGLTPEEIDLMWETAPPRMPISRS